MTIVSFSRRFIFIKTAKTAGSSMEVHLAQICGPDDIVTPINPPNPRHQPRNHGDEYYNHMPAERIRALQPKSFAACYKFCFERHPVDKCLSHFAMLRNSPHHRRPDSPRTWQAYLEQGRFPVDIDKYSSADGELLVNRIYRYEELDAALRDLEQRLNCRLTPFAAQEKSGFRYEVPSLAEVMGDKGQKARIMEAFSASLRWTPYE